MKPDTSDKQSKADTKRGAPIGYEGKTRRQIPRRKEIIDCEECLNCLGHHLKDEKIIKQIIEEVREPVAPEIIEGEIHKKKCLTCGTIFLPPQNTLP